LLLCFDQSPGFTTREEEAGRSQNPRKRGRPLNVGEEIWGDIIIIVNNSKSRGENICVRIWQLDKNTQSRFCMGSAAIPFFASLCSTGWSVLRVMDMVTVGTLSRKEEEERKK